MIKLSQVKEQEIRRGMTLVGPHRDDLAFSINGKEVQSYGSQGQQRTTALSLKLAEIELIHEEIGEYPILLLDDVLSELDQYRQTQLIETFQSKVQTFITTTGIESVNVSKLAGCSYFPCAGRPSVTLSDRREDACIFIWAAIKLFELRSLWPFSIFPSRILQDIQAIRQSCQKKKEVEAIGEEDPNPLL